MSFTKCGACDKRVLDRVLDSVVGDERLSIAANWSAGMLEVPGK